MALLVQKSVWHVDDFQLYRLLPRFLAVLPGRDVLKVDLVHGHVVGLVVRPERVQVVQVLAAQSQLYKNTKYKTNTTQTHNTDTHA
jgi:hypothetical protein